MASPAMTQPKTLLFDIDGTVLDPQDNLQEGIGLEFLKILKILAGKQYEFVFITGNDYKIQTHRVLDPVIKSGIAPQVFCFSDGGSRAFEYNKRKKEFEEIKAYSADNIMKPEQVETIKKAFHTALEKFLEQPENDPLRRPQILWHERTLDYLDIRIFPLKPSFIGSSQYRKFCKEIEDFAKNEKKIGATVFQLVKTYPGSLIIRAVSRSPEFDANLLQNFIAQNLMHKKEYSELSKPEAEARGGEKTISQIALKPFNDEDIRIKFREYIEEQLRQNGEGRLSVLLGGRTTIDIQKRGVNKEKAIRFLMDRKKLEPQNMIYFGNEFNLFGNDRSVAEMEDENRPGFIVNVGRSLEESERLPEIVIEDGNGPRGTLNYLKFLLHAGRYFSEDVVNILAEGNQPANPNKIDLAELLTKIDECFNLADFKTLCFALEIDYDNLSGETKVEKSRELISYSISHSIFNVLISELQKRRPMVNWKPELE